EQVEIERPGDRVAERRRDGARGHEAGLFSQREPLILAEVAQRLSERDEREDFRLVERRLARQRELWTSRGAGHVDGRRDAVDVPLGCHVERRVRRLGAAEPHLAAALDVEAATLE